MYNEHVDIQKAEPIEGYDWPCRRKNMRPNACQMLAEALLALEGCQQIDETVPLITMAVLLEDTFIICCRARPSIGKGFWMATSYCYGFRCGWRLERMVSRDREGGVKDVDIDASCEVTLGLGLDTAAAEATSNSSRRLSENPRPSLS